MERSVVENGENSEETIHLKRIDLSCKHPFTQDRKTSSERKFPRLPFNMTELQSTRFKYLHNLQNNSLDCFFIMKPELKIKLIEETLNTLNKKDSIYKHLQKKSVNSNFKTSTSLSDNYYKKCNRNHFQTDSLLNEVKLCTSKVDSQSSTALSSEMEQHIICNTSTQSKYKNKFTGVEKGQISPRLSPHPVSTSHTTSEGSLVRDYNGESDNQFEFTVEGEKIVSFVCSTSPSKNERSQSSTYHIDDCENNSDSGSNNQTGSTSFIRDLLTETVSNTSCEGESFEDPKISLVEVNHPLLERLPSMNEFPSTSDTDSPIIDQLSSLNRSFKTCGPSISINYPYYCNNPQSNDDGLSMSLNQETVLFREATLRGCYNIENILSEIKPPLVDVEKETSDVKRYMYSSIRSQKTNGDVICDTILSVLEICKSWIKLNSHFERKEFKDLLNLQGIDISVLYDFFNWQSVSRSFIDKMIQVLKKIAFHNTTRSDNCSNLHPGYEKLPSKNTSSKDAILGRIHFKTHNSSNFSLTDELNMLQSKNIASKMQVIQTKHWKQRRFYLDQPKLNILENNFKKFPKSKFTVNSSSNSVGTQFPIIYSTKVLLLQDRQGSVQDVNVGQNTETLSAIASTKALTQSDMNFFPGIPIVNTQTKMSDSIQKTTGIYSTNNTQEAHKMVDAITLNSMDHLYSNSTSTLMDSTINNHASITFQNFPSVPPNFLAQLSIMNSDYVQSTSPLSNNLTKTNPIHCVEVENCLSSNYIKPGSYNPPQKSMNFQKSHNNTVMISDIPITGVTYIYNNTQTESWQIKPFAHSKSCSNCKVHTNSKNVCLDQFEIKRKTDPVTNKTEESTDMKSFEPVLKPHFLLFDESSNYSSSTDAKYDSEIEELSPVENLNAENKVVLEQHPNMDDWLTSCYCKSDSDKYPYVNKHSTSSLSNLELLEEGRKPNKSISPKINNYKLDDCVNKHGTNTQLNYLTSHLQRMEATTKIQKKLKRNKKVQDEYLITKDQKNSSLKNPKPISKYSITKKVSDELIALLDLLGNIEVSSLAAVPVLQTELVPEKDPLRLTTRKPLQAIECKLINQGYDTLEQVCTDFEQFFKDIKTRNKENKQCISDVSTLEEAFSNLIKSNFGMTCQFKPDCTQSVEFCPRSKPRKQKRNFRRC